jgi:hypothetical protein
MVPIIMTRKTGATKANSTAVAPRRQEVRTATARRITEDDLTLLIIAAEERDGKVRWLRPEFQAPKEEIAEKKAEQIEADLIVAESKEKKPRLAAALPDRVAAVRAMLAGAGGIITAADLARRFSQGKRAEKKVEEALRTLALLGQAERIDGGYIISD